VRSARLELALSTSSTWSLCRWSTSARSRHPVSNRAIRRTKAKPQAVRGGEAAHPGLEPGKLSVQSRAGLPIPPVSIECGRCDSNAHAIGFEPIRYACSRHARAGCATRVSNPVPQIKSLLHHLNACSAWSGQGESNPRGLFGRQVPQPFGHIRMVPSPRAERGSFRVSAGRSFQLS
jgi:hypothetical protein